MTSIVLNMISVLSTTIVVAGLLEYLISQMLRVVRNGRFKLGRREVYVLRIASILSTVICIQSLGAYYLPW